MKRRIRVISLVALVGALLLAGRASWTPPPDEFLLDYDEHRARYESDDNGYHDLAPTLSEIALPGETEYETLTNRRVIGDASGVCDNYLAKHRAVIERTTLAFDAPYVVLPRLNARSVDELRDAQQAHLTGLQQYQNLARLLMWDGNALELDGKSGSAIERYLDAARLGQANFKSGLVIDAMVGVSIINLAMNELVLALDHLTEDELYTVVTQLGWLQSNLVPIDEIFLSERAFNNQFKQSGFLASVVQLVIPAPRMSMPNLERSRISFNNTFARITGTRLRAQVNLYTLQHESQPTSLAEVLAPDAVPIDLTTGNPFEFDSDGKITNQGQRPDGLELQFF